MIGTEKQNVVNTLVLPVQCDGYIYMEFSDNTGSKIFLSIPHQKNLMVYKIF